MKLQLQQITIAGRAVEPAMRTRNCVTLWVDVPSWRKDTPPTRFRVLCQTNQAQQMTEHIEPGRGVLVIGELCLTKAGQDGCKDHTLSIMAHTAFECDPNAVINQWQMACTVSPNKPGRIKISDRIVKAPCVAESWRMSQSVWFDLLVFGKAIPFASKVIRAGAQIAVMGDAALEVWTNGNGASITLTSRELSVAGGAGTGGDGASSNGRNYRTGGSGSGSQPEYDPDE